MTDSVSQRSIDFFGAIWKALLLIATIALIALFALGLKRDPNFMPSALIDRTMPQFELQRLGGGDELDSKNLLGKPLIINFWASWCGACRSEHATLLALGREMERTQRARVVGINHRDTDRNALRFLSNLGTFNYPSGIDSSGQTGVDFGVFGLPETFFIDAAGTVRVRHIGPLTQSDARRYLDEIGASK